MEISDRRRLELMESFRIRQRPGDPSRLPLRVPRTAGQILAARVGHLPAGAPLTSAAREVKRILLVDSDPDGLRSVQRALCQVADVEACSDFAAARARLREQPPDLLVTNLRLQAFNGLHLIHVTMGMPTRCIAYSMHHDVGLAREVQEAGAFYERDRHLPLALTAYVNAVLPPKDRRDPALLDRRRIPRGGRRCIDL